MRALRIAGIQTDLVWEDIAANHAALGPKIDAAADEGAELIVLPEMFPSGFSMDTDHVAETPGGPSETFLLERADRHGVTIAGSIALRAAGEARPRNVAVVAGPDGVMARYAKIHPFSYGREAEHYAPGEAVATVDVGDIRVTPLVCYDLRFPELFALLAPRTDVFVVMANWPAARAAHWRALLVARAIECQAYVLGVNRIGEGGGLTYGGGSLLIDPLGAVLADGGRCGATLALDIDAAKVASIRQRFSFLADRRPALYRRLRGDG